MGSGYPNALSQIRNFVLLDSLGSASPVIPSYCLVTNWVYQRMANLEVRMRQNGLLETDKATGFFSEGNKMTVKAEMAADYMPFMEGGIPFVNVQPLPLPSSHNLLDDSNSLDLPTVRDWVKIVTGFTLEWLDMMEVWPE